MPAGAQVTENHHASKHCKPPCQQTAMPAGAQVTDSCGHGQGATLHQQQEDQLRSKVKPKKGRALGGVFATLDSSSEDE